MAEPTQDELEAALQRFHDALDVVPYSIHGRDGDWVDGSGEAIVEALLKAGWKPPDA